MRHHAKHAALIAGDGRDIIHWTIRIKFITNLASKGISVRVLASLAGHRSIAVTQKYIDVNDDMKRNAVELAWCEGVVIKET